MSSYRLSADECSARWGSRGEHPTYTRSWHAEALRAPDRRKTVIPVEPNYWQWVSDMTADTFHDPSRGLA